MPARQCHHCHELVDDWTTHNCWITTEAALTRDLSEDLQEAYARLRKTAAAFGKQRIYASHHCIMFSRKACYFFVRPRRNALEVCIFLGRTLKAPQVRRTAASSRSKTAHIIHVKHRDEVESPFTDWLAEAYEVSESLSAKPAAKSVGSRQRPTPRSPAKTRRPRPTK